MTLLMSIYITGKLILVIAFNVYVWYINTGKSYLNI